MSVFVADTHLCSPAPLIVAQFMDLLLAHGFSNCYHYVIHGVLIVLMYMCGYAKYDVHVVLHISLFSFMFYYFSPSCCSTQECLLWVSLSLLHLSSPIPSLSSPTHHHHQPTLLVRTALHLILQATARISRVPQNTYLVHTEHSH